MTLVTFTEGDTNNFEAAVKEAMETPIKHFEKELASIRTGRATISLIENIPVQCYGQTMTLRELATLSAPDARLLVVQPWDKSIIGDIEKSLQVSDIGINPINDGETIRLQFPMISTERREELIKQLNKKTEECRVGIRSVRKEFLNQVRATEKNHDISEDFAKRLSDVLQKITDSFIVQAEQFAEKKTKDLRHI